MTSLCESRGTVHVWADGASRWIKAVADLKSKGDIAALVCLIRLSSEWVPSHLSGPCHRAGRPPLLRSHSQPSDPSSRSSGWRRSEPLRAEREAGQWREVRQPRHSSSHWPSELLQGFLEPFRGPKEVLQGRADRRQNAEITFKLTLEDKPFRFQRHRDLSSSATHRTNFTCVAPRLIGMFFVQFLEKLSTNAGFKKLHQKVESFKETQSVQLECESKAKVRNDPEAMSRFRSSDRKLQHRTETKAAGRGKWNQAAWQHWGGAQQRLRAHKVLFHPPKTSALASLLWLVDKHGLINPEESLRNTF